MSTKAAYGGERVIATVDLSFVGLSAFVFKTEAGKLNQNVKNYFLV